MEHRLWKSALIFILTLVLTVGTIATLSMATAAKTETASAQYSQQVRERQAPAATELSATIPEEGLSPLASAGAFLLILSIPGTGVFLFLRARKKGREATRSHRRYSPRADMAFQASAAARTRV